MQPDSTVLQLARWLNDRLPIQANYEFPFDKLLNAFRDGKAIKLTVTPISATKYNVELTIEHFDE